MVDGFEDLSKSDRAYLCLQYSQENREPVNNIGAADSGSEQYNKIEEGYRLYLSTDEPDLSEIYGGSGVNSVSVVYSSHGLRIVRIVPKLAVSGDEITVRFVVIKGIDDPQVSFAYSFSADYFRSPGDEAGRLSFTEDPTLGADVFNADFALNLLPKYLTPLCRFIRTARPSPSRWGISLTMFRSKPPRFICAVTQIAAPSCAKPE